MRYIIIHELLTELECRRRFLIALETMHPSVYLTDNDRALMIPRIKAARLRLNETEQKLKDAETRLNAGQLAA